MKIIESIKLHYRARKYQHKSDPGGIAYLREAVRPGQTVLDIGAHKGGYLYFLQQQVGRRGQVVAFEPQGPLYTYLKRIKELFRWDNVTIEHLALSDQAGSTTLYIPTNKVRKGTSPGATIVEKSGHGRNGLQETVSMTTLDSYCREHDLQPSFLKIDVEGNELAVLRGGLDILRSQQPRILIEIEARHIGRERVMETFQFLESLGYTGHCLVGEDRIPLSAFSFETHQDAAGKGDYGNNFIFEAPLSPN